MPRKMTGIRKQKSDLKKQDRRMKILEEGLKQNKVRGKKAAARKAAHKAVHSKRK